MPDIDEIMVPEADHCRWILLPKAVQQCVWNVYRQEVPEPSSIKAVVDYSFKAPDGKIIHLFSGTYRSDEEVPEFDSIAATRVTLFGEEIQIKSVAKKRIGSVDFYDVRIDAPQGEKT